MQMSMSNEPRVAAESGAQPSRWDGPERVSTACVERKRARGWGSSNWDGTDDKEMATKTEDAKKLGSDRLAPLYRSGDR